MSLTRRTFLKLGAVTLGAAATNAGLLLANPSSLRLPGHVVYHFNRKAHYATALRHDAARRRLLTAAAPGNVVKVWSHADAVTLLVKRHPGPAFRYDLPMGYVFSATAIYDGDSGGFQKSRGEAHEQQLLGLLRGWV